MEVGETAEFAALRETSEELGVSLPFKALAALGDAYAITGTHVSLILGGLDRSLDVAADLRPPPGEVAGVFALTLRDLAQPQNHRWEWRTPPLPPGGSDSCGGAEPPPATLPPRAGMWLPVFDGGPHAVWGLTAWLLMDFMQGVAAPVAAACGSADDQCLLGLRPCPRAPPPLNILPLR